MKFTYNTIITLKVESAHTIWLKISPDANIHFERVLWRSFFFYLADTNCSMQYSSDCFHFPDQAHSKAEDPESHNCNGWLKYSTWIWRSYAHLRSYEVKLAFSYSCHLTQHLKTRTHLHQLLEVFHS